MPLPLIQIDTLEDVADAPQVGLHHQVTQLEALRAQEKALQRGQRTSSMRALSSTRYSVSNGKVNGRVDSNGLILKLELVSSSSSIYSRLGSLWTRQV